MAPSTLKEKAEAALKDNPSALGDPISLKAETSTSTHDLDADQKQAQSQQSTEGGKSLEKEQGGGGSGGKTLKEKAEKNPTMLGDPTSLKTETIAPVPTEEDEGVKKRDSKL